MDPASSVLYIAQVAVVPEGCGSVEKLVVVVLVVRCPLGIMLFYTAPHPLAAVWRGNNRLWRMRRGVFFFFFCRADRARLGRITRLCAACEDDVFLFPCGFLLRRAGRGAAPRSSFRGCRRGATTCTLVLQFQVRPHFIVVFPDLRCQN